MRYRNLILFLGLLTGVPAYTATVIPLEITVQLIGPDKLSSFQRLLFVQITNPGYSPVNLKESVKNSELIIDGKPSKRTAKPFLETPGLAPMGEWRGCFSFDSYEPAITPGSHKIALRMNGIQSAEVKVRWAETVPWQQGNMKSRLKEIQNLGLAIKDNLPQSCVEQWLTRKDGGQQEPDKIRYVLEPQFKMVVPYRATYHTTGMTSVVDGDPTIYAEQALSN